MRIKRPLSGQLETERLAVRIRDMIKRLAVRTARDLIKMPAITTARGQS